MKLSKLQASLLIPFIVFLSVTPALAQSGGKGDSEPAPDPSSAPAQSQPAANASGRLVGFQSNPNAPIPDNDPNGVCDIINITPVDIPAGSTLTEVSIDAAIDHSWVGDLRVELTAPNGDVLDMMNRPGEPASSFGDSSNLSPGSPISFADANVDDAETMGDTIGDVEVICQDDLRCAYAPNSDGGQGTTFAAAFNGDSPLGNWRLCIYDNEGGDVGTFASWTLNVSGVSPTAVTLQEAGVSAIFNRSAVPLYGAFVFLLALSLAAVYRRETIR